MSEKVGGFIGINTTRFEAKITFEKKAYNIGERININFEIDNSQCKKDLKTIKYKFVRKHIAIGKSKTLIS